MKARGDELEDTTLEIIDRVEEAESAVAAAINDLKKLQSSLEDLRKKRQELASKIDTDTINLYEKIRKQKKQAVAKVEQGICRACRISLSASVLQRARSGQPIQCGTCGRILYIS
jgi:predicted  nucleic acid-binding Zn-ribbon protein